eukprot:gb/GEZN01001053.1/.p1 GENE.gb/GEZN01001053.1/~~gb/GEZN01001053.1/.p1  ORF type:complete len:884 (-),score=157.77 gb/GEZN01001053.1/:335-2986(-)
MVNFTTDQLRAMMDNPDNIRNMSVIAHVDHGKSTLTDSLIGAAGIIAKAKAGDARFMDTREDEQERTITIKATAVSLYFALPDADVKTYDPQALRDKLKEKDGKEAKKEKEKGSKKGGKKKGAKKTEGKTEDKPDRDFLINLIDSPGHVDFSSEVTAALRVTDGALVVVDCIEGVCVQTETVLRQAISERIKPVLFVNKLDRVFLELHMDLEEAYQTFSRSIESVNVVIATYLDEQLGDVQVYPQDNNVGFGSGLQAWGFNIGTFARTYAALTKTPVDKWQKRLWGDNYFDPKTNKWQKKPKSESGVRLPRGFCQYILKPIDDLSAAVVGGKKDVWMAFITKMGVKLPKEANDLVDKPLLKSIMQSWLPAEQTLLRMIVNHLPSPRIAQAYRVANLYSGPLDDASAKGIRDCDPEAPLMMYVSKMVPTSEKGRFYAFGRVFSGILKASAQVRIQGPDYKPGSKRDLNIKKIQRVVLMMGRTVEQLNDCPCGNIIGIVGVDQFLLKSGTICSDPEAHNFFDMKYSVSPVVRVSVEPKHASDLPKLMEGLKRLAKSDPLVQCFTAPSGEHIVAGAGELHLEICIKDLRDDFMKGAPITLGQPVVQFCETVTESTDMDVMGKSPNKHNRISVRAQPLGEEFCKAIDSKDLNIELDKKKRAKYITDNFGWDKSEALKIWSFGCPPDGLCNVLVDTTKAVQYLHEISDHVVAAFIQVSLAGVFCEEAMRGIRYNLMDVTLHADTIHRGAGQIMPPAKKAMQGAQIRSGPALLEPMYIADITVPNNALAGVYATLSARRGQVEGKEDQLGTPLTKIKAFLPVLESFGFTQLLRQNTSGQAFPQMIFSHWSLMSGSVYEDGLVNRTVLEVRARKGLREGLPEFADYHDKL